MGAALLRFLPKGWMWDKMIVGTTIGGAAQISEVGPGGVAELGSILGQQGVAVTMLRPSGQVDVGGRRYEAKVELGAVDAGDTVVVRGRTDFGLIVEKLT